MEDGTWDLEGATWALSCIPNNFHSYNSVLKRIVWDKVPFIHFCASSILLLIFHLKNLHQNKGHANFLLFLWFTFRFTMLFSIEVVYVEGLEHSLFLGKWLFIASVPFVE